jgi:hypothetical protein
MAGPRRPAIYGDAAALTRAGCRGGVSMGSDLKVNYYEVRVKHHMPGPNRYTWQIHRLNKVLPVKESRVGFLSWQDANEAGRQALEEMSHPKSS